jgi:transcriptional regulator with XRE-family HTH domain
MKNKDEALLIELGNRIKKRRNELDLSQEKLAEICDFDRTYISLLERAKRNPTYLNLKKLCFGLEIELSELI